LLDGRVERGADGRLGPPTQGPVAIRFTQDPAGAEQLGIVGCNAVIRVRYDRGEHNASATGVAVWLD